MAQHTPRFLAVATAAIVGGLIFPASQADAQQNIYAGIAYSQSTGKVGYTAGRARTEQQAQQFAVANCGEKDAKAYIWGVNEWVAIAVVEGKIGTAGFARDRNADRAQQKALEECRKRAAGEACRVLLCVHSGGARVRNLRSIARDPSLPPPAPAPDKSGFFAAIAFSPSTGRIGSSAGEAKTKEEAQRLALKNCGARDAKAFMWGDQWVAIAVCESRKGVAGFGPGVTREIAEQAALAQCKKYANGAPCKVALAIHSSGKDAKADAKEPAAVAEGAQPATTQNVAKPVVEGAAAATKESPQPPAATK